MPRADKETQKLRWGKPTAAHRATLRKAKAVDYDAMVVACLSAILEKQPLIDVVVDYTTKLPRDFPRAQLRVKSGLKDVRTVIATHLLEWLNKHGHTTITAKDIYYQNMSFSTMLGKQFNFDLEV